MTLGHVRDFLPRLSLTLPGQDDLVTVEFIIDTGFDGDLSLPISLISRLDVTFATERVLRLADGSLHRRLIYQVALERNDEIHLTEVVALENDPLLEAVLLDGMHVSLDMTDGGDVQIKPL
jgi:predicted aspartyl protease